MIGMPTVQLNARDQEVVRANRELAAYFRGQRTEREARAALKIIKAFIRDRLHTDPAKRRPLPRHTGQVSAKPRKPRSSASRPKRSRKKPPAAEPVQAQPQE
jgi:hypothetical protein